MESDINNTYINPKAAMLAARAIWVMIWMAPVLLEEETCSCWSSTLRSKNPLSETHSKNLPFCLRCL